MLILKWLVIVTVVLVVCAIAAGQLGLLTGRVPRDLGARDGKLKGLSATPNSISSQAALYPGHPQQQYSTIAPLDLRGDGSATLAKIKTIVEAMDGGKIVKSEPTYLYAEFTTPLMKYVDDVEFWLDPAAKVIHVRSASRLGKSDLGANRKRLEAVRAALASAPD